jgi:hypothetical protein
LAKSLTIWIPTYQRESSLLELLASLESAGLIAIADVIVSDNDPDSKLSDYLSSCDLSLSYRRNVANLSAGVNFLRAFEVVNTPWLMIVGDDDLFTPLATKILTHTINDMPEDVAAVKFDSGLFGRQSDCTVAALSSYLSTIAPSDYPHAFNNLLLVSNWLFRTAPCRRHLATAYLGYSTKFSHLLPPLKACAQDGGRLMFSSLRPVTHGLSEGGWPKAATWYEMAISLSTFSGIIDSDNRSSLRRLLFHKDWGRTLVKCLRVSSFYGNRSQGVTSLAVHLHLALLSWRYGVVLLFLAPLLWVPQAWYPGILRQKLGDPGSVERW